MSSSLDALRVLASRKIQPPGLETADWFIIALALTEQLDRIATALEYDRVVLAKTAPIALVPADDYVVDSTRFSIDPAGNLI